MKRLLFLPLMLITIMMSAQISKNFIDQNYIEVTGKAEIEVVPNQIYLTITISESDTKGKVSVESLEKDMMKALIGMGINVEKDLVVKDMASNFKEYWLRSKTIFTSKQYQLLVKDATTAGKVFQQLEKLGISNLEIEKVDHSEMEKFKREVKVKAVIDAKEKAESMASAIGQVAGKALYIREMESYYNPMRQQKIMVRGVAMMEAQDAALPEIGFESIKLEYSVQAYFEMK